MKATLFLTMSCNLCCDYCYVRKHDATMSPADIQRAIDFIFAAADPDERLDFGLFGGEPLLHMSLVENTVDFLEKRSEQSGNTVRMSLVTNGTLLNDEILRFVRDRHLILQVSCDGAPLVQDRHRRFTDGRGTSAVLETALRSAVETLPAVLVNLVYSPDTYQALPGSIEYLAGLGLRQIILNPDYSAAWSSEDIAGLKETYNHIAGLYLDYYTGRRPLFISLIDEKIAIILRGGYGRSERCRMGYREFAFSPQGNIFPCERLVGDGEKNRHCIGHLDQPDQLDRRHCGLPDTTAKQVQCRTCGVSDYCMHWCGCSNFLATGDYHLPSPFICASERLAIEAAFSVLRQVNTDNQLIFINHYAGLPMVNSSVHIPQEVDPERIFLLSKQ